MIYCKELSLYHYRCYASAKFNFSDHINILVGDNAVGKTSIVEAIYALGQLKSHKATDDKEMISRDELFTLIKGNFNKNEKNDEIKFSISENGKAIIVNEKKYQKLSSYLGYFTPIIFCPEDLDIIKGAPSERRKFLDSNLSLVDSVYLNSLMRFKKLLKERNEVLKGLCESDKYDFNLLEVYTSGLVDAAEVIIAKRNEFIEKINPYLKQKSLAISGKLDDVGIIYKPNVEKENIRKVFNDNKKIDISAKTTTAGPHRDDFLMTINAEDAKVFASQGQQRSAVLALKLALANLIKDDGKDVIVILDDVFSELDNKRQNEILDLIAEDVQIFITTTQIDSLEEEIIKKSNILRIER